VGFYARPTAVFRIVAVAFLPYCAEGIQEQSRAATAEHTEADEDPYVIGISLRWRPGCAHVVWGVMKESPAAEAGILPGDRLIKVDGRALLGVDGREASALIRSASPGSVSLALVRKNEEYSASVRRELLSAVLARQGLKLVHGAIVPMNASVSEIDRRLNFDSARFVTSVFPLHYPADPELYFGGFEVMVLQKPDEVMIGGIEDGPGQDAGLRWGDRILSVEGTDPRGRSQADLEGRFSSKVQKSLALTVERNGRTQAVAFTLERGAAVMARNGMRLERGEVVPVGLSPEDAECLARPPSGGR
jgi:C-terminal processing protease CtpA/Prc